MLAPPRTSHRRHGHTISWTTESFHCQAAAERDLLRENIRKQLLAFVKALTLFYES